jgi:hypothetical protein
MDKYEDLSHCESSLFPRNDPKTPVPELKRKRVSVSFTSAPADVGSHRFW